ncbi:hypothetical protein Ddc_04909 [Ditylenchus destructor]|nr:hypothetical protein Ddc_04909 [Ditylenchus destructor]
MNSTLHYYKIKFEIQPAPCLSGTIRSSWFCRTHVRVGRMSILCRAWLEKLVVQWIEDDYTLQHVLVVLSKIGVEAA